MATATRARSRPSAGPSEDAVRRATGKGYARWFAALDRFGAAEKGHAAAAKRLAALGASPWWSQTIVVAYERTRGLRTRLEHEDGFAVSATRTMPVPASRAFRACVAAREGGTFGAGAIRSIRPGRRLVVSEGARGALVEVVCAPKGRGKTAVSITHTRLASRRDAEAMRVRWRRALASLAAALGAERARRG